MKAVIKTGGKQYYVSEGDIIYVEKLDGEAGDKVVFNEVLLVVDKVGNPYLDGASVEGESLKMIKQKRLEFSLIKIKTEVIDVLWVIDNHIQKLKSKRLKVNYD